MMQCVKCRREVPDGPYCCQCGAKQSAPRSKGRRANGTGGAYKRGKTWTGRATGWSYTEETEDGRLIRISHRPTKSGFKTKTEALEWAAKWSADNAPKSPTMADLWRGWSDNDMLKLSRDKQIGYKMAWKRLRPIAGRRIDELTIDDLQKVVNTAPSYYTARDMRTVLSHLYKRAMANRQTTVNLSRFLVLPDLEEKEAQPFSADEVSTFWKAWEAGEVFVGYVLLMIYSGMMPAELKACRKDMIDRDACEIFGCGKKTKQRKKELPIVFPDFLLPVIDALCAASDGEMLLPYGHNQFYDKYHAVLKQLGVRDLPPYSCRHTFGTAAVEGKNSPEVVRQMLRHATILTQQRYTHLSPAAAHEAANALKH